MKTINDIQTLLRELFHEKLAAISFGDLAHEVLNEVDNEFSESDIEQLLIYVEKTSFLLPKEETLVADLPPHSMNSTNEGLEI